MKPLKILNLYAGIGGNRKLWGDNHQVTAVEFDKNIASVYSDLYPSDTIIVGDAHGYLLAHANEFDFIWLSPPCPTHSDIRRCGVHSGQYEAVYPDMTLYQEIIFLQNFFKGKFVVENVKPYYEPLIAPSVVLHRHFFWTNFDVDKVIFDDKRVHNNITGASSVYGVNLKKYGEIGDKRKMLRNMVNPSVGLYLFEIAINFLLSMNFKAFDCKYCLQIFIKYSQKLTKVKQDIFRLRPIIKLIRWTENFGVWNYRKEV